MKLHKLTADQVLQDPEKTEQDSTDENLKFIFLNESLTPKKGLLKEKEK